MDQKYENPSSEASFKRSIGPKLHALLLAQPLNDLVPLQFSELPSRQSRTEEGFASASVSDKCS